MLIVLALIVVILLSFLAFNSDNIKGAVGEADKDGCPIWNCECSIAGYKGSKKLKTFFLKMIIGD